MISTRDLRQLPDIPALKKLTQSLAMLDAIMKQDWQYRYYSFNAHWDRGEQMASMSNGSGDEWYSLFTSAGVALKGFDHESAMSPWAKEDHSISKGVLDELPVVFSSFLEEPAFDMENTTFCIWRRNEDPGWQVGRIEFPVDSEDPDGSASLLALLDGEPATYKRWAEEYYERPVSLAAVQRVYAHEPLTESLAKELNAEVDFEALLADAAEIGYPAA